MATRMQQRRGTASEWGTVNPVLSDGEIGVERDTGIFKVGDGVAAWNALPVPFVKKSGGDTITASAVGVIPLILKMAAGQTANAFEVRDSAGTVLSSILPNGNVTGRNFVASNDLIAMGATFMGGGSWYGAQAQITPSAADRRGLIIRGAAGQTASLAEFQDSAGNAKFTVRNNGSLSVSASTAGQYALEVLGQTPLDTVMRVRGAAGQTANLAEFQNSAGVVSTRVNSDGSLDVFGSSTSWAVQQLLAQGPAVRGLVVRAASGQTANLAEFQDINGTTKFAITSVGALNTQTMGSGGGQFDHVMRTGSGNAINLAGGVTRIQGLAAAGQPALEVQNSAGTTMFALRDAGGGGGQLDLRGGANSVTNPPSGGALYVTGSQLRWRIANGSDYYING